MATFVSSTSSSLDQDNDQLNSTNIDVCSKENDVAHEAIKMPSATKTTLDHQSSELPSSSLYRATELWIDELINVSSTILTIEKQLHDEFETLSTSTSTYFQGNQSIDEKTDMETKTIYPVPDLLHLVKRIQALSKTMMEIQQSCIQLQKRRNHIVPKVLKQLEMNQNILDQVSKNRTVTTPQEELIEKEMIEMKIRQLEFE